MPAALTSPVQPPGAPPPPPADPRPRREVMEPPPPPLPPPPQAPPTPRSCGAPLPPWVVAGGRRTKPQCAGPTARGTTAACCGRVGCHLRRWGRGAPPTLALSGAAMGEEVVRAPQPGPDREFAAVPAPARTLCLPATAWSKAASFSSLGFCSMEAGLSKGCVVQFLFGTRN